MHKLLTHYQLASLTESKVNKHQISAITRKRLAARILDNLHETTKEERANVLTLHELQTCNLGNAIRRLAQRYNAKRD